MENLTENKVLELLEHFENHITVHDDENELVLWRNSTWGIPETFAVQFNGKFLKTAKTLKTALKFFNSMIEKYNLSTELILNEYNLENQNFKTMEHYKKIQNEILERAKKVRAKKVRACEGQYERAQEAKDFNELLKVVTDNFHYCCNNRIIDSTLLVEIGAEICQENNLYFNVSIGGNAFLLVDGSATVEAWGSAYVNAYTKTIEHKISDKAILRYYYPGTVLLSENLTLKNS